MGKSYTIILALLWDTFAVNARNTTPSPKRPIIKFAPDKSNFVLVGRNIKLEWSFKSRSVSDVSQIILFRYESHTKAKTTIALKNVKSGSLQYNRHLPGSRKQYVCEISYDENGLGKGSIFIPNVQFSHTFDYGISLKMTESHLRAVENSVSVNVVDMVLSRESKDLKTIRSWFGQRLLLNCDVVHHRNTRPLFKWYKKFSFGSKLKNLFAPNNTKTLVIEKVNSTDFGEYLCVATTRMTTVKQKFKVKKLGYASSPRNVKYIYNPTHKNYQILWEQPSTESGDWVRVYVLEEWKTEKNLWMKRCNITTLAVAIQNIKSATKYRICSANEIGYAEKSCSKTIELAETSRVTSEERGRSCQFWASLYLSLAMVFLSCVFSRYE